jgi:hypothetical protein
MVIWIVGSIHTTQNRSELRLLSSIGRSDRAVVRQNEHVEFERNRKTNKQTNKQTFIFLPMM